MLARKKRNKFEIGIKEAAVQLKLASTLTRDQKKEKEFHIGKRFIGTQVSSIVNRK